MKTDRDIEAVRDEVGRLLKTRRDIDRRIERNRQLLLRTLPRHHGFADMDALIRALVPFASETLRRHFEPSQPGTSERRGKGTRYGAEVRVAVRNALEAGESQALPVAHGNAGSEAGRGSPFALRPTGAWVEADGG